MSNVLIGIIGVILFIGLALAGAIFLGAKFTQTTSTSQGAASVQATSQVSSAINLANLNGGGVLIQAGADPATLQTAGYLKSIPSNPTAGGPATILTSTAAASGDDGTLVAMKLGGADKAVCQAIARQTTNGQDTVGQDGIVEANTAADLPRGPSGCFHAASAFGSLTAGSYYAFSRP